MTYPNAVFSVFAFIGFIMCVIPLPWHLQAWNTGTCLYMIWTALGCLNQFINSIVWNRNAINWAPVWCDISAKLTIGVSVAIPAASLCINRRLYNIASVRVVTTTKADKRRQIMIDLAIGLGLPILEMILQYIVQGHRFNIYEDLGCVPFSYIVWPIYPIVLLPPLLIGLVSGTYGILTMITLYKNQSQINAILSSQGNMNSSRFIRLMCLAAVDVVFTVPLSIFFIYSVASITINPWISWDSVHAGFSRVDQIPALIWRHKGTALEFETELGRWATVLCAFIFFAFFGFADEARKNYRSAFQTVVKRVGISTGSFGSGVTTSTAFGSTGMKSKVLGSSGKVRPILPVFVHQEMLHRHDSIDSFTNISMSIGDVGGYLNEKSDPEKEDFHTTLSYSGLSIADVGGTLADTKHDTLSLPTSAASSSGSSISYPSPALIRHNSQASIETCFVPQGSIHSVSPNSPTIPTFNSSQSPQPTSHNVV